MEHPSNKEETDVWIDWFSKNIKEILKNTLISGLAIFICSYGCLFLAIKIFPEHFVDYINPIFNSEGERDVYFYLHPFVLALSLSVFWNRFSKTFGGNKLKIGIEFGLVYAFVALVPILWITYSSMDVALEMVITWLIYGFFQSSIAGIFLALFSSVRS